jgi:hypothetical protein
VEHFFQSLVNTSGMTLHIRQVSAAPSPPCLHLVFLGAAPSPAPGLLGVACCGRLADPPFGCLCAQLAGKNSHHIVEATFKAFARALRQATEPDPRRAGTIPR